MPKVICKCNYVINLSDIPSPNQLLIISDVRFDDFSGLVDAEDIYKAMDIVALCSNCGRLHIFYNGFNNSPVIYSKESGC